MPAALSVALSKTPLALSRCRRRVSAPSPSVAPALTVVERQSAAERYWLPTLQVPVPALGRSPSVLARHSVARVSSADQLSGREALLPISPRVHRSTSTAGL